MSINERKWCLENWTERKEFKENVLRDLFIWITKPFINYIPYIYVYVSMHAPARARVCVYTYTAHMHIYTYMLHTLTHTCLHTDTHMSTYTHTYIRTAISFLANRKGLRLQRGPSERPKSLGPILNRAWKTKSNPLIQVFQLSPQLSAASN